MKNLIPREISWVEFNKRVLEQSTDKNKPLLERLKFLSIVSSNFDEFFMVRIASLKREIANGDIISCPSKIKPSKQLEIVDKNIRAIYKTQYNSFNDITNGLKKHNLIYVNKEDVTLTHKKFLSNLFSKELFSILSPIRLDYKKNLPVIQNLGMNIGYLLQDKSNLKENKLAVLQIPRAQNRIIWLPDSSNRSSFILIEDVIEMFSDQFFPGYFMLETSFFRLTRDADLEVNEDKGDDFVEAMEEVLIDRLHSKPIRMEIDTRSESIKLKLLDLFNLSKSSIYEFDKALNLKDFMELSSVPGFDKLKFNSWKPIDILLNEGNIWKEIQEKDTILHHPYDSFNPVIRMLKEASLDESTLSIKMTLYRTSGNSPIIKYLKEAAINGIQVIVLMELKARFDEARNILWAKELERAGVIVIYGVAQLKVHSKALIIIRRETDGIRRYIHLSTGNYNDKTAKLYTDLSLITCNDELTYEVSLFFNVITGYSSIPQFKHIVMSPDGIREKTIELINRVIKNSTKDNPGLIMAKMNSLAHPGIINALYEASTCGVKIKLNIRGISMLKPGIPGVSENIEVISIIDRYLEHSRIYYFKAEGIDEVYLSSADWMPRNLEKRIEVMFPILNFENKNYIKKILTTFFNDNTNSSIELPDGTYIKINTSRDSSDSFNAQRYFHDDALNRKKHFSEEKKRHLKVRRKISDLK